MSDDRRVVRRQDDEVRRLARQTKEDYGIQRLRPVNIIRCLESGSVLTCRGRKKLAYRVLDDTEMGADDGKTEFTPDVVIISVKRSVHQSALWGDGRSRMTLAHELGHAVLHYGDPLSRTLGAAGATSVSRRRPEDSAEHQAKVFAPAFLIDDAVVEEMSSPEEVSLAFGVSFEAATICFERVQREKYRRQEGAERVRLANERFQAEMRRQVPLVRYSERACPECRNKTMAPSGFGLLCHTCGFHETGE
jgi:hypothetical protein